MGSVCATTRGMRRMPKDISPEHKAMLATVAANVQRLRLARGWTQVEAARRCGLSKVTFQCVEVGETCFTSTTLSAICSGFEVGALALFEAAPAFERRRAGRPRKAIAHSEAGSSKSYRVNADQVSRVAESSENEADRHSGRS